MADYQTIEAGTTDPRGFTLINRQDGSPITVGSVNYFLKALTGADAGKWWRQSDGTWQAAETANPMTYENADAEWSLLPIDGTAQHASPFTAGVAFLEYAKESTDAHVPQSRRLRADPTPWADSNRNVRVEGQGNPKTAVDHNTGGADNLRCLSGTSPVNGVAIRAYTATAYAAGDLSQPLGSAVTGPDGRWLGPMYLTAGFSYTLTFAKPGDVTTTATITI